MGEQAISQRRQTMWNKIKNLFKKWWIQNRPITTLPPIVSPPAEKQQDATQNLLWLISGDPHQICRHATGWAVNPFTQILKLPISFEITGYNKGGMWVKNLTVDKIPGRAITRNLIACTFDADGYLIQTEDQSDSHNSHIGDSYDRVKYYMAIDVKELELQGRTIVYLKQ